MNGTDGPTDMPDGHVHTNAVDQNEAGADGLTMQKINAISDLVDAMTVADEFEVDIGKLETDREIKARLKCHLTLQKEGNMKEKIEKQICELGEADGRKREKLSQMIKDLKAIFPEEVKSNTRQRQSMMEELLLQDGSTENIREDCDKRLTSLKEKECVILVSGESSAGKSSLLNLMLGNKILPSHMLPCTSCITVIKYDSYSHAKVLYRDGRVDNILNLDRAGLEKLQQRAYYSDANRGKDIYAMRKEEHDISEIQVYLPLKMLYSGLVLVDTPGVGENEFLENYLMDYIRSHHILGFMYIIMTDYPLGIAEDRLVNLMSLIIKSQKNSPDVVKFSPKAALFVCNRWDMVPDKDKTAVRQNALKQLGKAWPDFDPKNAVFFSTFQAQREQDVNIGYVTDDFIALLYGFHELVSVSLDKRIKASYRWLGKVLQRSVHYLRTVVRHLELNDRQRQQKTQATNKKLKTLNNKAYHVVKRLHEEMELSVQEICSEVRKYLQTTQAKTKLTSKFGAKDGELPDMERASGTWDWVKRHIDAAFENRLTDVLAEWDEENQVIKTLERKLFREAKLELCDLENELADLENRAQNDDDQKSESGNLLSGMSGLCRSLEDFEDEEMFQVDVPNKLVRQLKNMLTKTIKKKQDISKLKDFEKEPEKVSQKRAEKMLSQMIKDKDERLEMFVRDLLHRPFNYIRRLEETVPSLIRSNLTLLERFEKELAEETKGKQLYTDMMTQVEKMRASLVRYGEHHLVNDFAEDEIEILQYVLKQKGPLMKRRSTLGDLMSINQSQNLVPISHYPFGLWHTIFVGRITKGSETRDVLVKLYAKQANVTNIQSETAKLRCLLHTDVSLSEFLGVYMQRDAKVPALIFAGKLMSVNNYIRTNSFQEKIDKTKLLRDVLAGLQYIHGKGLVHMDLTKDSVTVTDTGEVRMTGMCLPRTASFPSKESKTPVSSFVYLPPEVLNGAVYSTQSDMFSFALLCLEVKIDRYTAFVEHREKSFEEFLKSNAKDELEERVSGIPLPPTFAKNLLAQCLDVHEGNRPTALQMSKAFDNMTRPRTKVYTPRNIFGRSRIASTKRK